MNLIDIQELSTCLSAATLADPFLSLCSAIAWLDPLCACQESFIEETAYGDGVDDWTNIGTVWELSRTCFPSVYAETTLSLRSEVDETRLADQLCIVINQHLVGGELHDLEQIHFGLPFFGLGIDLTDPQCFAAPQHEHLLEIYSLFDVEIDPQHTYSLPDNFDHAATAADALAHSLRQTGEPSHANIAWLLEWMFSQTGNSVADYSEEEMFEMEMQPLAWEPADLAFSNEMHAEAQEIIEDALQGLDHLLSDAALQATVRANFKIVSKAIRKVKNHDHQSDARRFADRLRWADHAHSPDEQRPANHAENLSLRCADAA